VAVDDSVRVVRALVKLIEAHRRTQRGKRKWSRQSVDLPIATYSCGWCGIVLANTQVCDSIWGEGS
jgi:hypothetical protein